MTTPSLSPKCHEQIIVVSYQTIQVYLYCRSAGHEQSMLWIALTSQQNGRADGIGRDLSDAGIENPLKVLHVGGNVPGKRL